MRLLIPDRVADDLFFTDDEITALLELEDQNVKQATALALETMASDQAMVLKAIKLLQLSTDGPKVSDALLKRAKLLREQAAIEASEDTTGGFEIAEWVVNPATDAERYYKQIDRLRI